MQSTLLLLLQKFHNMRYRLLIILSLICGAVLADSTVTTMQVACDTRIELSCTPYPDYHFVQWSDGETDSVRIIQVNGDATYIAYIAPNCEEHADLPVLALYDWLIMLNVRSVHNMGYEFNEGDVKWYRVVSEPDKLTEDYYQDDEYVCTGYYLTLDKNLKGTGDYYAVVDVRGSVHTLCTGLLRTVIVQYTTPDRKLSLAPTWVYPGQQMKLSGLDPSHTATIEVFDMVGKLLSTRTSSNQHVCYLNAEQAVGFYNVVVSTPQGAETFRYLVQP